MCFSLSCPWAGTSSFFAGDLTRDEEECVLLDPSSSEKDSHPGRGRGWMSLLGVKEALRGTGESWHLDFSDGDEVGAGV